MEERWEHEVETEERRPFEAWVEQKKPEAWLVAAARALRGWAIGREVTEAEFDRAITEAGNVTMRS